jgi:hypothetical protein
MMPHVEFVRRMGEARREEIWFSVVWLVVFFAVLFGQVPLAVWVTAAGEPWLIAAQIVGLFTFLFGNLCVVLWYYRHRAARFGLVCKNCGMPLHGLHGQFVVQTSRCPKCGVGVCER